MYYINLLLSYEIINKYLPFFIIFLGSLFTIKIIKSFITLRIKLLAKKTKNNIDDLIVDILKTFNLPFYIIISLLISIRFINLNEQYLSYINSLSLVVVVYYVIQSLKVFNNYIFDNYISNKLKATNTFKSIINIFFWILGFVLVLQYFGYNISTFVAGLGIGGVAIAFAIQNILSDIFSSFSIYLDKPFNEGDFIQIGNDSGTVKKIGVKSTRLITLQGEELIISNQELTTARVRNYKQMKKRRVVFNIGIVYETSYEKIKKVNSIVEEIISSKENTEFNRCTLLQLASDNIQFEIVYYINNQDYDLYMLTQESINLDLIKEFAKHKIEFAYPTQKVFVGK